MQKNLHISKIFRIFAAKFVRVGASERVTRDYKEKEREDVICKMEDVICKMGYGRWKTGDRQ